MIRKITYSLFCLILLISIQVIADNPEKLIEISTMETVLYQNPGWGWTDNRLTYRALVKWTGEEKDGWYNVIARNGEEGWVAGWLSRPAPEWASIDEAFKDDDFPTTDEPFYARVTSDNVTFRVTPYGGLSAKRDNTRGGFIPRGSLLKLTDRISHWFEVQLSATERGWVCDEALTPSRPIYTSHKIGIQQARVKKIRLIDEESAKKISIELSSYLPYSVSSNIDPDLVKFKLYGVDCTKLRWRWDSACKKTGGWCRCTADTSVLEGNIYPPDKLYGFSAGYNENSFVIELADTSEKRIKKIVLDPGHGAPEPFPKGYAEGAHGPDGILEKDIVMETARYVKTILEDNGFEVLLTRDGDSTDMMDLYRRVEYSDAADADLFVSIHANGDVDPEISGIEIYWYEPMSRLLAESVAKEMAASTARETWLTPFGSFAVIRQTRIPSVLVEMGYMTNPTEGNLFKESSFLKSSAEGIANGIIKYVGKIQN
ncbi:MAG TPA: N-acetylmuramoyl-L-alanine amidase [bacterium]|nr:N-acetylmuramoyl-L-alanine amidase [bacterium]